MRQFWYRVRCRPRVELVGWSLAAAALVALIFGVQPLERELIRTTAALERVTRQPSRAEIAAQLANAPPAEQLRTFNAFFQREERLSDWLAMIYATASKLGLELAQADYRFVNVSEATLLRYQITLPVKGQYGAIRAFSEGLLNGIPILSLDKLSFRRKSIHDPIVEAEIAVTLYLAPR